jgi:predicted small lipoprotein YifL
MSRERPTLPLLIARWVGAAAMLVYLAAVEGCGQSGPLVLPGSVESPPAQTAPAEADEPDPQDEEQEAE